MRQIEIEGRNFIIEGGDLFSPAEERALENWLAGMSAQDAANARHRSVLTIKTQRRSIREKTGQSKGEGALVWCLAHGYIRILSVVMTLGAAGLMLPSPPMFKRIGGAS